MNYYKRAITKGLVTAGFVGLLGCVEESCQQPKIAKPDLGYFAAIRTYSKSGVAITNGDFDDDGDLDLIVGAYNLNKGKLVMYLFENDGNGNFSLVYYNPETHKRVERKIEEE